MTISRTSAKRKGRALEALVVQKLKEKFPEVADGISQVAASCSGNDIVLSPAAQRVFPFSVECKRRAAIALIYDALAQAASQNDRTPIAVVQADRKRPLVVIDLHDFLAMMPNT